MFEDTNGLTFEKGAYRSLLLVFNLFLVVSWMPRITTIGDTDIGLAAVLLVLMVPLLLVLPRQPMIDPSAWKLQLLILSAIGFVIFWGYVGMYRLDNPMRAGRLMLSLGQGIILILVVSRVLSTKAIRFSLGLCLVMLMILGLMSLYAYLGGQPVSLTYLHNDRSSGLFKNPNQYGIIASMAIPFAAVFFFQHRKTVLALLILIAAALGLLLAASKTNIVIAIALLFLVLIYGLVVARRAGILLMLIPTMAMLFWLFGLPVLEFFNPRAAGILVGLMNEDSGQSASTLDQRYDMWRYSLDVIKLSPLFGEGTGQKIDVITKVHSHSHNVFMDLGRTTGIPGLVGGLIFVLAGCWLAISSLIRLMQLPDAAGRHLHGRALVAGAAFANLSYVLSNQMSDSLGPSTSVFLWLTIGVLLRRHELVFSNHASASVNSVGSDKCESAVSTRLQTMRSLRAIR